MILIVQAFVGECVCVCVSRGRWWWSDGEGCQWGRCERCDLVLQLMWVSVGWRVSSMSVCMSVVPSAGVCVCVCVSVLGV